jgi:DEAD/DEAH box helicase domain-containing protein
VQLRSERDLPGERDGVYLPMVQCSQCRTTGWLSRLVQGSSKLSTKLDEIYNTWFSRRPGGGALLRGAAALAVPCGGGEAAGVRGCGNVQQGKEAPVSPADTRNCCRCSG